jgi:hypothetical protein
LWNISKIFSYLIEIQVPYRREKPWNYWWLLHSKDLDKDWIVDYEICKFSKIDSQVSWDLPRDRIWEGTRTSRTNKFVSEKRFVWTSATFGVVWLLTTIAKSSAKKWWHVEQLFVTTEQHEKRRTYMWMW